MHEDKRRDYIHSRKKDFVIDMDPVKKCWLKFMVFDGFNKCGHQLVDPAEGGGKSLVAERGHSDTISLFQNKEEYNDSIEDTNPKEGKTGKDFGVGFLYEIF
jgi:hypothetical protein